MNKHWLSIAALCLLLLPVDLRAQFYFFTNSDNTITITGYAGSSRNVTIPGKINGLTVTIIADSAFDYSSLTNVTITNTVISIGVWAFGDCSGLRSVTIPASITNIGYDAFGNCSNLTNIAVNAASLNYTNTGGVLFNKSLTQLIQYPAGLVGDYPIPGSVTNITSGAFYGCARLTRLTIPDSVTGIGDYAFVDCSGLTNVAVDVANPNYAGVNGVLFNKTLTALIEYPGGLVGSYTITDSVTDIASGAFNNCVGLTNVTIGNSVASIGDYAFYSSSGLTSIVVPNSVLTIGDWAFSGCVGLTSLSLGNNVTNIGEGAFDGCSSLKNLALPDSLTSIRFEAFSDCSSLTNVGIGIGVTDIDYGAFIFCTNLARVSIPDTVTNIGNWAFSGCSSLTNVMIGKNVNSIGQYAFYECYSLHQAFFVGNAPLVNGAAGSVDNTVFLNFGAGTVNYLPGTTGWATTFGGWPTALWNPQMQTADSSFGIKTNQFGFNLTGTTNIPIVIEATTNLSGVWTPLLSGTITNGSIYFADSQWTNYPQRFYRVRSP